MDMHINGYYLQRERGRIHVCAYIEMTMIRDMQHKRIYNITVDLPTRPPRTMPGNRLQMYLLILHLKACHDLILGELGRASVGRWFHISIMQYTEKIGECNLDYHLGECLAAGMREGLLRPASKCEHQQWVGEMVDKVSVF